MYELLIRDRIEINHKIRGEHDEPGVMHDHRLLVGVIISLPAPEEVFLPLAGVIELVGKEIKKYDAVMLNTLPVFENTRVLLEDLARIIFQEISARTSMAKLKVIQVEIEEELSQVKIIYHQ